MRKLIYFIFIIILGLSSTIVVAQGDLILDRFDALGFDGKVQLTCVISSGNTCGGINIFRSENNSNFQRIGEIPGICGSTEAPVLYDFIDENPLMNTTSYYKLELGGVGFTDAISITIRDLQEDQIRIRPNPAQSQTIIYFSNPVFLTHTLNVLNSTGQLLLEYTTSNDFFDIDVSQFSTGVYPIVITSENSSEPKFSKLVVQ